MTQWSSGDSLSPSNLNARRPSWSTTFPFYDVGEFGADATGAADSTTSINNALSIASGSGGIVYVPPGTYAVSSILTVFDGVQFVGSGMTASVLSSTVTNVQMIDIGNDSRVADLQLLGNTATSGGHGINGGDVARAVVERCYITRCYHGINTGGGNEGWRIVNNVITLNRQGGILVGAINSPSEQMYIAGNIVSNNSTNGIDFNGYRNIVIGNEVRSNGTDSTNGVDQWGILLQAQTGADADDNVVANNRVEANMQHGIVLRGADGGASCDNNVITNNLCLSNGSATGIEGDGIVVDGTGGGSIANNLIQGNICRANTRHGILVDGSGSTSVSETLITGNACVSNDSAGIALSHASNLDTSVFGNSCLRNANSAITRNPAAAPTRPKVGWNSTDTSGIVEHETGTVRIGDNANSFKRLDLYGYANATGSGTFHSIYGDDTGNSTLNVQPIGGNLFTFAGDTGDLGISGRLGLSSSSAPASGTAAGATGEITWGVDSNTSYLYVCVSTDSWMRTDLSPF